MNRYQQRRHRGDQFGGDPARSGFGHFGPEGQWEKHGGPDCGPDQGSDRRGREHRDHEHRDHEHRAAGRGPGHDPDGFDPDAVGPRDMRPSDMRPRGMASGGFGPGAMGPGGMGPGGMGPGAMDADGFVPGGPGRGGQGPGGHGRGGHGRGFGPGGPGRGRPRGGRGGVRGAQRGDVRAAVLRVLASDPMHGYQIAQAIEERTSGAWRPSPGAIYPTLALLDSDGLITVESGHGRKVAKLTDLGREHLESAAGQYDPFERFAAAQENVGDLRASLHELHEVVRRVMRSGTPEQTVQASTIVDGALREVYLLLANSPRSGAAASDGTAATAGEAESKASEADSD